MYPAMMFKSANADKFMQGDDNHGMQDVSGDLEKLLSLKLIRSHTKTDDKPSVTDDLLRLYRNAAIEAAEIYTGAQWSGISVVRQSVDTDARSRNGKVTIRLKHPTIDGRIVVYGKDIITPIQIIANPGDTKVRVPSVNSILDSCCSPCGANNFGVNLIYRTGWNCENKLPSGIILGCLKYIAWTIQNSGANLVTMNNKRESSDSGVAGTNDAVWASGAAEQWNYYRQRISVA